MKHILTSLLTAALLLLTAASATAQVKITGIVVDEKGQPIEFASVKIAGTAIGVNTDTKGRYEISAPTRDTVMVVFSCLGYSTVKRQLLKPTPHHQTPAPHRQRKSTPHLLLKVESAHM